MTFINASFLSAAAIALAAIAAPLSAAHADAPAKPVIVLVHGAFADATGWSHVIPLLEKDGYTVFAVQNSLTSLDADVATTKRVIEAQKGPVVVVGHSYGGAVITGAAADQANVKALVYLAAFAPDSGEAVGVFADQIPLAKTLVPDAAGFLYIDRAKFHDAFCADVPAEEAHIMGIVQKPLASAIFGQSIPAAAWKTIPSWYLVSQDDHAISPDLERFYAKRMGAQTSEIKASHVAFISHPKEIVHWIEEAANASAK
ncbi:alpha/beta hydrolase [Capsulimonas corticalis]|uniref:Alpha/beta hydrolase n=1 Tax=Capsulimonas corticalis TaxID=2219043 RepID=A0A402D6G2_9BACT|nr:alpha/beta hydrolase [Capsulimonas corticalis]BDI32469.1 alpha/beta hydrolase [Capsulimonas corticalis]